MISYVPSVQWSEVENSSPDLQILRAQQKKAYLDRVSHYAAAVR